MRNDRYDSRDTELGAFLDRPLHAVEFENRERERYIRSSSNGLLVAERKLDAVV
jgi:hypothetical protein